MLWLPICLARSSVPGMMHARRLALRRPSSCSTCCGRRKSRTAARIRGATANERGVVLAGLGGAVPLLPHAAPHLWVGTLAKPCRLAMPGLLLLAYWWCGVVAGGACLLCQLAWPAQQPTRWPVCPCRARLVPRKGVAVGSAAPKLPQRTSRHLSRGGRF